MLKEYLLEKAAEQAVWSSGMPGVQVCRVALAGGSHEETQRISIHGQPLHFETFFCLAGRLMIKPLQGEVHAVESPGVFLLSDDSGFDSCICSGDLCGILVAVDARAAKESLMTVCSSLGMNLDTRKVKEKMAAENGCMTLFDTPWTRALFQSLRRLPETAQECYCVFKTVELLYLFCSEHPPAGTQERSPDRYDSPRMQEVKAYLLEHLAEKITIERLCKQFSVSPTFLKEGFRRAYGMPVHAFLIQQRITRARELLCTTRIPIQRIAQAVGYEGMSQFNAAFKRHYGMTPGQYRKMSETAISRPF